ncbi:MAG TPA: hypothetical protein PLY87_01540 [Planctomycetaceae bacterium]|nr:hypothetical protein [Planctomycetaceae bacterium]
MVRSPKFVSNDRLISASQDATVLVWDVSGKRSTWDALQPQVKRVLREMKCAGQTSRM